MHIIVLALLRFSFYGAHFKIQRFFLYLSTVYVPHESLQTPITFAFNAFVCIVESHYMLHAKPCSDKLLWTLKV